MEQNNWLRGSISITEYKVSSKGIRHIRTTVIGNRQDYDPKPHKGDDKPDKPE